MSITEKLRDRLIVEAEEAETQNLVKIAENLTKQIEKNEVRPAGEKYIYSKEKFEEDIESSLWDVIIRASDFYGKHIDAQEAEKIVCVAAANIISDFKNATGAIIGANELPVPGEVKEEIVVEIDG